MTPTLLLPSVTTIIGRKDKPALVPWAARETAKAAVYDVEVWRSIEASKGVEEAISWLTRARFRPRDKTRTAADLGTAVHAALEALATGGEPAVDDEVAIFYRSVEEWWRAFEPEPEAVEAVIWRPTGPGYAGRVDGIFRIGGERWIVDLKTSSRASRPYTEVCLQLAAYRRAPFLAVDEVDTISSDGRLYVITPGVARRSEHMPTIDRTGVLQVTPDGWGFWEADSGESAWAAFCGLAAVDQWERSGNKMIREVTP